MYICICMCVRVCVGVYTYTRIISFLSNYSSIITTHVCQPTMYISQPCILLLAPASQPWLATLGMMLMAYYQARTEKKNGISRFSACLLVPCAKVHKQAIHTHTHTYTYTHTHTHTHFVYGDGLRYKM
jgi:hypothetical protein